MSEYVEREIYALPILEGSGRTGLIPINSCTQEFSRNNVADRDWQEICAIFRERNQLAGSARDVTARGVEKIAALYEREEARWEEFLVEHGVEKPRRGPKPKSRFHGIARYLLGLGIGGDQSGTASVLAACLDAWLETRETVPVDAIPNWIQAEGGTRAIYESTKPESHNRKRPLDDIIHTGNAKLAEALVRHAERYMTAGTISLDPCRGKLSPFYNAMREPKAWCEIREGKDFLDWTEPVGMIATNTPWSDIYSEIAAHAFNLADVVVFLLKWQTVGTYARLRAWREAGHGLREIIPIRWEDAGFVKDDGTPKDHEGLMLAAFIWVRGYNSFTEINDSWLDGIPEKPAKFSRFNVRDIIGKKSNDVECYTPKYIFDALGCRFDLDPASPGKNVTYCCVPADRCYTRADDVLTQPWHGYVWLNAPYGVAIYKKWTRRFAEHGNGVILVKDATTTHWYHHLSERADLFLALDKKIPFIRPGMKPNPFGIGHQLIAIGERGIAALENAHRNGLGKLFAPSRIAEAAD
jgi:hypothetical protein